MFDDDPKICSYITLFSLGIALLVMVGLCYLLWISPLGYSPFDHFPFESLPSNGL